MCFDEKDERIGSLQPLAYFYFEVGTFIYHTSLLVLTLSIHLAVSILCNCLFKISKYSLGDRSLVFSVNM